MIGLKFEVSNKSIKINPSYPSASINNKSKVAKCLFIKLEIFSVWTFSFTMSEDLTPWIFKCLISNELIPEMCSSYLSIFDLSTLYR